uniref:ABC transporter domain-containing protein n=1 Tax=Angiostrongylus cantonensis TaxID=6313 RepID=A0A0K0DJL0_ANGCA
LLAIMGSSGAGKTTLLNVLASRNLSGLYVTGSITIDGQRMNKWKLREISAFVQQHDMFVGTMTVREHLQFMAKLRMGSGYTTAEQKFRVEYLIRTMGLIDCAETLIGISNTVRGLSCGEMKRLAFATDMLTRPQIFFCDEPTSGLDAFMAGHVVASLRRLADDGMTVVITIHQPSSQVYSFFNDICLMACGRIIYLGPIDGANALFESCGYPCSDYFNPSDHFIRTISVVSGQRNISLRTISKGGLHFRNHVSFFVILIKEEIRPKMVERQRTFYNTNYKASFWTQLRALTWRCWLTTLRDPMVLKTRIVQTTCAIITGAVYYNTAVTSNTIISINGFLFNQVRNLNFMLQFPAVPAITMELPIVLRENSNGVYTSTSYFLGKNLAELPQYVVLPAIFNTIVYIMAGLLPSLWTFFCAVIVSVLLTNVATSISYATATIFGTTTVATTVLPIFVVPMMAFGGFFITYESIPKYFTWLSTLSYFKYAYEGLAINQWETVDVIPGCLNHTGKYFDCPKTGSEVLESVR